MRIYWATYITPVWCWPMWNIVPVAQTKPILEENQKIRWRKWKILIKKMGSAISDKKWGKYDVLCSVVVPPHHLHNTYLTQMVPGVIWADSDSAILYCRLHWVNPACIWVTTGGCTTVVLENEWGQPEEKEKNNENW